MRIFYTDEMRALQKIYKPYEENCELKPDTPKEALDAFKKFGELLKKAMDDEIANNFI